MRSAPRLAGLVLCLSLSAAGAQDKELPPEILLLARIKARAAENLQRLPNYTCTETIERTRRPHRSKKFEPLDTLRLEVALVEGKELFSWPGAGKFEEKSIGEIVGGGAAIGNGNFALHAKSVFLSRWPRFTYAGDTTLNGRRAIRYDYRVPQMLSGYLMRIGANQAIVGYRGSFWVEPDTLDLIRLEVHADDLPPSLDLRQATDTLEYHRVRIGEVDFLLPESSELVMTDLLGNESRNRTRLSGCRQYAGESVLTFVEPPPDAAAPAPRAKPILLPAGLTLQVQLQTPIQSGRSATGDPVKALLIHDVKHDGEVVAPKGAALTGRITRLEKRKGLPDFWIVGLEFSSIEFDRCRGDLRAKLLDPGLGTSYRGSSGRGAQPFRWQMDSEPRSGGVFAVRGSSVFLRKGHTMEWRTQP